jgi:hypothetical protein
MSTASLSIRPQQRDPLVVFLLCSLLFHLLLLLLFPVPNPIFPPETEQLTEVELLPAEEPQQLAQDEPPAQAEPEAVPKEEPVEEETAEPPPQPLPEQIVNPPDVINEQIPDQTRFLSDRNTTAEEETVAVGTPLPSTNPEQQEQPNSEVQKPAEPPKEPTRLAALTPPFDRPLDSEPENAPQKQSPQALQPGAPDAPKPTPRLFASPADLLAQGFIKDRSREQEQQDERRTPTGNELLSMAPPARNSMLSLPGPTGTPDHLPDVRRGNMTFLNTKASRFAPFVRRVAERVFQHLVIDQRRNLKLDDVIAARDWVTIEAKLSLDGDLVGLVLRGRSGSYSIDESLLHACEQGAWDQNPPPEAQAEDGLIHFIFRSDIDAQYDNLGLRAIVTFLQVGLT